MLGLLLTLVLQAAPGPAPTPAAGADPRRRDVDGVDALRFAPRGGDLELVALMRQKGCDLKQRDARQRTLLHLAAADGSKAVVEYLLREGLAAQAWDSDGKTPADLAVGRERDAIRALLGAPPAQPGH